MSGVAGRKALVKVTGEAVAFLGEATTAAGNIIYQITNAAKRVWDRTSEIVVYDNGIEVDPEVDPYTINRLTGRVIFETVDAGRGPVTVDGDYLPVAVAAGCKQYSWSLDQAVIDDTDFDSANTESGFTQSLRALLSVQGSLGRRWRMETYFEEALMADGIPVVIEFFPDRSAAADLIVWALLNKSDLSMVIDGAIDGNVGFVGAADADGRVASLPTQ
jgi:hypothetical protein